MSSIAQSDLLESMVEGLKWQRASNVTMLCHFGQAMPRKTMLESLIGFDAENLIYMIRVSCQPQLVSLTVGCWSGIPDSVGKPTFPSSQLPNPLSVALQES